MNPRLNITILVLAVVMLVAVLMHSHAQSQPLAYPTDDQQNAGVCIALSKYCSVNN